MPPFDHVLCWFSNKSYKRYRVRQLFAGIVASLDANKAFDKFIYFIEYHTQWYSHWMLFRIFSDKSEPI